VINPTILKGACHCGAVAFEVETPAEPAVRCNCSLCRRRGAVMHLSDRGIGKASRQP